MLQYVGGRNTSDVDLIIAVADLETLPGIEMKSHDSDFARAEFEGVQVDALLVTNPLFARVKDEFRAVRDYAGREIPTATAEGLIILKLYALPSLYRQGDVARIGIYESDVFALLSTGTVDLDRVFAVLETALLPTDIEELRRIVGDVERRIAKVSDQPFSRGATAPPQ